MNFIDYLLLLRRHAVSAVILIVIVIGSTLFLVGSKNSSPYETTIFISMGGGKTVGSGETPSFDTIQASDQFSETVQGWFKNPEFQKRIAVIPATSEINARKQEKQNILVTFTNMKPDDGEKESEIIKQELEKEIQTYNTASGSRFDVAIFSSNTETKPLSMALFFIISLIGGTMMASFALYGYEYIFQLASSTGQVAALTGKKPIDVVTSSLIAKRKLDFLNAYLQKSGNKHIQVVGIDKESEKMAIALREYPKEYTLEYVHFPEESKKIHPERHTVLLCSLGKSKIGDISKALVLIPKSYDLVIKAA